MNMKPTKTEQRAIKIAASFREREQAAKDRAEYEQNKKLVGRCYRYKNSYGCGSDQGPWWLYKTILVAEEDGGIRSLSFEWDSHGNLTLKPNEWDSRLSVGWQEISKEEFNQALLETKIKVTAIKHPSP